MNILAFSGRKQSGKSTSAEYVESLCKQYKPDMHCKIYSFADPLKIDICMNLFGLTYEQCYGSDEDKNSLTLLRWENMPGYDISWTYTKDYDPSGYMTARQVMEYVGTNVFRKMKNNIWVEATIKKIQKERPDLALIPDCRFPNEVDCLLQHKANVIRLTLDPFHSSSDSESALDSTKYDWTKFSIVINNQDKNIESKNKQISEFLHNQGIFQL